MTNQETPVTLSFDEFRALFHRVVEEKLEHLRTKTGREISSELKVQLLYGKYAKGTPILVDEALQVLYINEREFWKIIDIIIYKFNIDHTLIIMSLAGGGGPVPFEKTAHMPKGSGPFKISS